METPQDSAIALSRHGLVEYRKAWESQRAIHQDVVEGKRPNTLLLLEHPSVFTAGRRTDISERPTDGTPVIDVDRGGKITWHGPGQLIGYPIVKLLKPTELVGFVREIEAALIAVCSDMGLHTERIDGRSGVWVRDSRGDRKVAAIGIRVAKGVTMHGFALNVSTDLSYMREHIVPCGIAEYAVTSLAEEGIAATMFDVVNVVSRLAHKKWGNEFSTRYDIAWAHQPERDGLSISVRKPDWIRPHVNHTSEVLLTKKTLRDLNLVTVCEEAGCPNLSECWKDGTATFMVLGDRCTRACGFCLIDTRKPLEPDANEPARVAEAVKRMGLEFAVLTMVARDDLADGGMQHVANTIRAIRNENPGAQVEALISDAKGTDSLDAVLNERPDVLNHNIETVARLQRMVRPSAGYARSLSVLARSRAAGLTTKSGLMLGLGETRDEVEATLIDLASVGVNIVTIGQYLRPSAQHLPVVRYAEPSEFEHYKTFGERLGINHVESSPLTRSSYHAKDAHRNSSPLLHV